MENYNINGKDVGLLECVATLKVKGIPDMSDVERANLADWLRRLADDFEKEYAAYSKRFSAKLYKNG